MAFRNRIKNHRKNLRLPGHVKRGELGSASSLQFSVEARNLLAGARVQGLHLYDNDNVNWTMLKDDITSWMILWMTKMSDLA